MNPFWSYYGGKFRAAPHYPPPRYNTIIEPFAGAAGYSMRYPARNVILVEKYPIVAGIWRWLIAVKAAEVRAIPLIEAIDDLPSWVPQEARWLVGFTLNAASCAPRRNLSAGRRKMAALGRKYEGWTEARRERVASQVDSIRHWKIIEGEYQGSPDLEATWFIDPPYEKAGKHYIHSEIDFDALANWCMARNGQVVVCEAEGATWLPFKPFGSFKSARAGMPSREAIFTLDRPVFVDTAPENQ